MTLFKKTTLIAFIAQAGYFLLSAFAFGKGQYLLHDAAAVVAGLYLTARIIKKWPRFKWFSPFIWLALALLCYQAIISWIKLVDWTQADIFPTDLWNVIQFLDLIIISLIIGAVISKVVPYLLHGKPLRASNQG